MKLTESHCVELTALILLIRSTGSPSLFAKLVETLGDEIAAVEYSALSEAGTVKAINDLIDSLKERIHATIN